MKTLTGLLLLLLVSIPIMANAAPIAEADRIAYVTSEGANTVTIIDLNTEQIVKVLPTGKVPHALAFTADGKGYVNNRGSEDLTVIDGNRYEVITTIPLPAISNQLALSPDGKILAVTYKNGLKVTLIDTASDEIIKTIQVGDEPSGYKGVMMRHPYWTKDGRYVYVSDNVNNNIVKVDASTFDIVTTIAMPGGNHYMHPAPDGRTIYAGGETGKKGGTSVTLIDTLTDTIVKDIPIPLAEGEPGLGHHGEFTPDGKYFFFGNEGGRTMAIIDTSSLKVAKVLLVGMGAGHPVMREDGKYFFVVHHKDNMITVVDIAKQEIVKEINVGEGKKQAHSSYFTPDGRFFYMINAEDNMMYKLDAVKMEVISKFPVGKTPMFFAIREAGEFVATE
ncbi:MAG: cytochrome D1 domain-containing protein [Negativicutes bacterium]|nr:cytochrome D1 domain-containing protein [Negativicutes bacterium]